MTSLVTIPLGDWMPDAPTFQNPGCIVADNVLPTTGGYGPLSSLVGRGDTVTGDVQGARHIFDNAGGSIIIGGASDRLFVRRASITETTGLTSIGSEAAWDFTQFNDFVFAIAPNNALQHLTDVDSDDTWSAAPGSPPTGECLGKANEFLLIGAADGVPNRIQWGAYNNPAGSWAVDRLTQAGFADLPMEYGIVQRIIGGRYATVFQKRGIHRLSYVGPPKVWHADIISDERGATARFAVVPLGYLVYFLAQDGFYVTNGAAVEPIGSRRINDWFFENINQTYLSTTQGAVDWQNECIVWSFVGNGSETRNRIIIYSWAQNRWSTGTIDPGWLVGTQQDGIDIDSLDATYGDLDSIPLSLDSAVFAPKDRRLASFVYGDTTSEYSTFTGTPLRAEWLTGQSQPSPGRRGFVSEAYPLIEADEWDMLVSLRQIDNRGQATETTQKATGWSGFAPVRGEGQKLAVRMVKPAGSDWRNATGVQVAFAVGGLR